MKPLWEYVALVFVCVCLVTIFGMSLCAGQAQPRLPKSPLLSPKALQLQSSGKEMTTAVVIIPDVIRTNFVLAFDGDVGDIDGGYYSVDGTQDFKTWSPVKMFVQGRGAFYYTNTMSQPFQYYRIRAHSGI